MKKEKIAVSAVWLTMAACCFAAMWVLTHPPRMHHPASRETLGEWRETWLALLAVACLLLVARRWLVRKLTRFFLAAAVVVALLLEPLFHWWGIPHPEGLWLPYLEGGAVASAILRYWQQIRANVEAWFKAVMQRSRH